MMGYPLEIRVIDIMGQGVCPLGLKVGDCFASDKELAQACHWAAHVLLPFTTALRFGGQVPWEDEPGLARACCLDHNNPVVFEVRRVEPNEERPQGFPKKSLKFECPGNR